MGKHSAPRHHHARKALGVATIAMSVAGVGGAVTAPSAQAAALTLTSAQKPKKIDEPGTSKDVLRLPKIDGVSWRITREKGNVRTPETTGPTCTNTTDSGKYCDVAVAGADGLSATATKSGLAPQSFGTFWFSTAKGTIVVTSATSPRPIDKPGYAEDGVYYPSVKGITWNVSKGGSTATVVDPTTLDRGVALNNPGTATATTAVKKVTVTATVNTTDYNVADDSDGFGWDFNYDVTIKDAADFFLPGVEDLGGIKTDAVVAKYSPNAKWYVGRRAVTATATRDGRFLTGGKTVQVVATPNAGYQIPTSAALPAAPAGLKGCAKDPAAPAWAKPGSASWTCTSSAAAATITTITTTPTIGEDKPGTLDDSTRLTGRAGVKWSVTSPSGTRTVSVAAGQVVTYVVGHKATTFGSDYQVKVRPVVTNAADYAFAPGVDSETTLTFKSQLTPVTRLDTAVSKIAGDSRTISITGKAGVSAWVIKDGSRTRTVRVRPEDVVRFTTSNNTTVTVTPKFDYGYGVSSTSSVGLPLSPA